MTDKELAYEIAKGIGITRVEGGYESVSRTTADGDYPSMGCSQWEGLGEDGRGDALLMAIEGGDKFVGRSYSDIEAAGELDELSAVLASSSGQEAQNRILAEDCLEKYVPTLIEIISDPRAIIYCGIWCPTGHGCVAAFLRHRVERGYDVNSIEVLRDLFYEQYPTAAGYGDDAGITETYQNRAITTYAYVAALGIG